MTDKKIEQCDPSEELPNEKESDSHQDVSTKKRFPIVGIGASAGGLVAFEAFFSGMPADVDPNMAFVLVQHLSPDYKSILPEIIRRYTRMEVFEVTDGITVKPNCVYIIPPNCEMALLNGNLELLTPSTPRGQRLPIDFFFRSLAQDQQEHAVGIVLSGTGSDGTLGVRAIKGEGGMLMAQTPESTEHDGMPTNAIATGMVDYELPPAKMAAQLIAYIAHTSGRSPQTVTIHKSDTAHALNKIFVLLRSHTGHDFSQYKKTTVHRRIERRMAVHQIKTLNDYVRYLQQTPTEIETLFADLLIGVTNFFRDPEAFKALEKEVIPKLFSDKPEGGTIRVWSPGCSTGEEAYSIAILLAEYQERLKQNFKIQVFGTDIDNQAIATARAGIYPASISIDISSERLKRFFTAESDGKSWRIHKRIRDILIFSEQNIIKDPPFSKLDLISCRNLMIYMTGRLQKKVIQLFHYALNPGAMLFLGTSETTGDFNTLFATLDRKMKIYQRKEDRHNTPRIVIAPFFQPMPATTAEFSPSAGKRQLSMKQSMRQLTEGILLNQVCPTAVLVNAQGDILYIHGRTGKFLELMPGEIAPNNMLSMAREGLKHELTIALHKTVATREIVRSPGIRVKTNGDFTTVNLTLRPVLTDDFSTAKKHAAPPSASTPELMLYLVTLDEVTMDREMVPPHPLSADQMKSCEGTDEQIVALKKALQIKEEYLQAANEELETSNEELKSSNEEMQSMNEELQSTNEELETSKEELQSVNEELATVNAELQAKVSDLSQANNDMNNLLAGTGIATLFVDHDLRILRFTPTASAIINLILTDMGRPVAHVVTNLIGYDDLVADTQAVLDTLVPKELRVQTKAGRWYNLAIQPYRTLDNVIEGAVMTFVDITKRDGVKKTERHTQ